jgi:hypothetical protein
LDSRKIREVWIEVYETVVVLINMLHNIKYS